MFQENPNLPVTSIPRVGKYHAWAEAIRWSAARTRPYHGGVMFKDIHGDVVATCAWGALAHGLCPDNPLSWSNLFKSLRHPIILGRIIERFEGFGWSREAIADWLETL